MKTFRMYILGHEAYYRTNPATGYRSNIQYFGEPHGAAWVLISRIARALGVRVRPEYPFLRKAVPEYRRKPTGWV